MLIDLDYFFKNPDGETLIYRLIQFSINGPCSVLEGDEFWEALKKEKGNGCRF